MSFARTRIETSEAPAQIALDEDGRVWAILRKSATLMRCDADGGNRVQVPLSRRPSALAAHPNGTVYVLFDERRDVWGDKAPITELINYDGDLREVSRTTIASRTLLLQIDRSGQIAASSQAGTQLWRPPNEAPDAPRIRFSSLLRPLLVDCVTGEMWNDVFSFMPTSDWAAAKPSPRVIGYDRTAPGFVVASAIADSAVLTAYHRGERERTTTVRCRANTADGEARTRWSITLTGTLSSLRATRDRGAWVLLTSGALHRVLRDGTAAGSLQIMLREGEQHPLYDMTGPQLCMSSDERALYAVDRLDPAIVRVDV